MSEPVEHIQWVGDAPRGHLRLMDQTRLPAETHWLDVHDVAELVVAIQRLSVRGAPAIGIAAAYGCVLAMREDFEEATTRLAASRPTAVNLTWAVERMRAVTPRSAPALLEEARALHAQDAAMCQAIGEHALRWLTQRFPDRLTLLTHCNAGALATGGIGTATAAMYLAQQRGLPLRVFADETRPLLQGARLTAWELARAGIDVTVLCDGAAATLMARGDVDAVITGADRIAANGDAANKIGTYALAVAAHHHGVPLLIAAPSSTFDLTLPSGAGIPIEQRSPREVHAMLPGVTTYNPAFDVTPAELISALVTERGVVEPVDEASIRRVLPAGGRSRGAGP